MSASIKVCGFLACLLREWQDGMTKVAAPMILSILTDLCALIYKKCKVQYTLVHLHANRLTSKGCSAVRCMWSTHPLKKSPPPPHLSLKGALRRYYILNGPFQDRRGGGGDFSRKGPFKARLKHHTTLFRDKPCEQALQALFNIWIVGNSCGVGGVMNATGQEGDR